MTTPRPLTLAERVKKLEEAVKRIRLVPSTTQSDVAPLTTVKGAVWIDSSAGNEPKVWDGNDWVPARDATIATAQQTADTAQATVTPLVPLTDLATVTTGTTVTGATLEDGVVTGSLFRTAASGTRWEIDSSLHTDEIRGYTGAAGEVEPALIQVTPNELSLTGPDLGGGPAVIELDSDATTNHIYLTANGGIFLRGEGTATDNQMWVSSVAALMQALSATGDIHQVSADAGGVTLVIGSGPGVILLDGGSGGIDLDTSGGGTVRVNGDSAAVVGPSGYYVLGGTHTTSGGGAASNITNWTAEVPAVGITMASGVATVPKAGRYRVTLQLSYPASASAGSIWADVRKNGATTPLLSTLVPPTTANAGTVAGSKTVTLAAGDTVQARSIKSSAGSANVSTGAELTFFQIEWVGP